MTIIKNMLFKCIFINVLMNVHRSKKNILSTLSKPDEGDFVHPFKT